MAEKRLKITCCFCLFVCLFLSPLDKPVGTTMYTIWPGAPNYTMTGNTDPLIFECIAHWSDPPVLWYELHHRGHSRMSPGHGYWEISPSNITEGKYECIPFNLLGAGEKVSVNVNIFGMDFSCCFCCRHQRYYCYCCCYQLDYHVILMLFCL